MSCPCVLWLCAAIFWVSRFSARFTGRCQGGTTYHAMWSTIHIRFRVCWLFYQGCLFLRAIFAQHLLPYWWLSYNAQHTQRVSKWLAFLCCCPTFNTKCEWVKLADLKTWSSAQICNICKTLLLRSWWWWWSHRWATGGVVVGMPRIPIYRVVKFSTLFSK